MNGKLHTKYKMECDVCKRDRKVVEAMSTSIARAIKLVYKLEVHPVDLKICDKCNFHINLMEKFMENLLRFNFPTLTASKTQCFSCHSVKIVETFAMNDLVREMEDFHASPKLGAQYYACIDCVYKTRVLVKYKYLLANLQCRAVDPNIVDDLLHRMKRIRPKKKQRKQQQSLPFRTYKIDQLPALPVVSVSLTRLPCTPSVSMSPVLNGHNHTNERIGRPLKRKLERDFIYDMDEIEETPHTNGIRPKKTKEIVDTIPPKVITKTNPIVILEKLDPSLLLFEAARPETPPPSDDPFLPHMQTLSPLQAQFSRLFSSDTSEEGDGENVMLPELNATYPFLPELIQAPLLNRKSVSFSEDVQVFYVPRDDFISLDEVDVGQEAEVPHEEDDQWSRVIESAIEDA